MNQIRKNVKTSGMLKKYKCNYIQSNGELKKEKRT